MLTRIQTPPLIYWMIAILAGGMILLGTARRGMDFRTDSFLYIEGAEALQQEGLLTDSFSLIHWPPLMSIVLALVDINLNTMRWVHAAFVFGNTLAFAQLLSHLGIRRWLHIMTVLVVIFATKILWWHSILLSEPLFILLMQLAFIMLLERRWGYAAVFASLTALQRYAGVTIIAACTLYLFLYVDRKKAFIFGFVSTIPLMAWILRNQFITENAGRSFVFHPISASHIRKGVETLVNWFVPIGGLLSILVIMGHQYPKDKVKTPDVVRLAAWFSLIYIAFLVVSISFFDFYITLDGRILSPILLTGWIGLAWFIDRHLNRIPQQVTWIVSCLIAIFLFTYVLIGLLTPLVRG